MFKNFASKLFGVGHSKWTAKNRLQMVLVQDRSGLSAQDMDCFRKDLFEVISKYFVLETKGFNIDWQRQGESTALIINTPVMSRHTPEKAA